MTENDDALPELAAQNEHGKLLFAGSQEKRAHAAYVAIAMMETRSTGIVGERPFRGALTTGRGTVVNLADMSKQVNY